MSTSMLATLDIRRSCGRGTTRFDALLALLDTPDSGAVLVDGNDAERLSVEQTSRLRTRRTRGTARVRSG